MDLNRNCHVTMTDMVFSKEKQTHKQLQPGVTDGSLAVAGAE